MHSVQDDISVYASKCSSRPSALLEEIEIFTKSNMDYPQMLSGKIVGKFLKFLIEFIQPKRVFDIGTFTAYSCIAMAEGLPRGSKIYTFECSKIHVPIARKFIEKSEYRDKIELVEGDALVNIAKMEKDIEFAFIDADKKNHPNYYELILEKLSKNGIMVIDNVLWYQKVLKPQDKTTKIIDELNRTIAIDDRVENILLTIRDGMNVVRKL